MMGADPTWLRRAPCPETYVPEGTSVADGEGLLAVDCSFWCSYNGYNERVSQTKRISSRFSMAVHILSLLSLSSAPCTSEWIAGSVQTNPVVIRKTIGLLKKAGLVNVRAGTGGAYLEKSLDEITLLDVYRAVEVVDEADLFHFHDHPNPDCPVGANIESVLRVVLLQAQEAMEQVLAQVSLRHLVTELSERVSSSRS